MSAVALPAALIAAPPLELWPTVLARGPVPADVEALLVVPLRGEPGGGRDRAAVPRSG